MATPEKGKAVRRRRIIGIEADKYVSLLVITGVVLLKQSEGSESSFPTCA